MHRKCWRARPGGRSCFARSDKVEAATVELRACYIREYSERQRDSDSFDGKILFEIRVARTVGSDRNTPVIAPGVPCGNVILRQLGLAERGIGRKRHHDVQRPLSIEAFGEALREAEFVGGLFPVRRGRCASAPLRDAAAGLEGSPPLLFGSDRSASLPAQVILHSD